MAWQKTFTLAKRSKGCHLVTEEVLSHIEPGLNEVQVWTFATSSHDRTLADGVPVDRNAILVHVGFCRHRKTDNRTWLKRLHRQHTSAALTVNENYDRGRWSR